MRFLVDENTGVIVARRLRCQEHEVFSVCAESRGIILLRLKNERSANKIETLQRLLKNYSEQLSDNFIVVTEKQVRFARTQL